MLQTTIIGFLGADAESKVYNGKEFITFRVSHSDRWKSEDGVTHEQTTWVDCVINGKSSVFPYLKKGTQVLCQGSTSLRVYSSPKDKCMKAGLSINVRICELVGGKPDSVPAVLYRADGGEQVDVRKLYHASSLVRDEKEQEFVALISASAKQFVADRQGWVYPYEEPKQ